MKTTITLLFFLALAACETETPTSAVVDNAGAAPVYQAWWNTTLFPDPVPAGQSSAEFRSVPANETAYALLAPGWDPASGAPPKVLVPVISKVPVEASRGDTAHIVIMETTFKGDCAAGQPLTADEAAFVTERIFPTAFAGVIYDAATCTTRPK